MKRPESSTRSTACRSSARIGSSGVLVSKSVTATPVEATGRHALPFSGVFVTASLTDPIVEAAVNVVDALGLPGIFILMLLESACIPIPSEATFLFAGFNASRGEYGLLEVVVVGTVANLVGSWL